LDVFGNTKKERIDFALLGRIGPPFKSHVRKIVVDYLLSRPGGPIEPALHPAEIAFPLTSNI